MHAPDCGERKLTELDFVRLNKLVAAGAVPQLADVLDRFAPQLSPWTRCLACNALLQPVDKANVCDRITPGTRRHYDRFVRCSGCGRIYWNGAHHARLQRIVDRSTRRGN